MWRIACFALFLYSVPLTILHFANPVPLIQIPDKGHRVFMVPPSQKQIVIDVLADLGLKAYGTFVVDRLEQTVLSDGVTVIASSEGTPSVVKNQCASYAAALSIATDTPVRHGMRALDTLQSRGIDVRMHSNPELEHQFKGKIEIIDLPFCWQLVLRLPGYQMPSPRWLN